MSEKEMMEEKDNFNSDSEEDSIKLVEEEENNEAEKDTVSEDETDDEIIEIKKSEYDKLKEECKNNYDKMLRSIAELENFRKRSQREREQYLKFSNENIIKEILLIYENLSRALHHSKTEKNESNIEKIIEGINMIIDMIFNLLKKNGVEEIEAEGLHFDPQLHEAVQMIETDAEDNIIVEVLQKGYKMFDKVIKPPMVVVNKKSSE
jgi:molecular chaperone GrpE